MPLQNYDAARDVPVAAHAIPKILFRRDAVRARRRHRHDHGGDMHCARRELHLICRL
jgi:hypothetical protein